VDEDKKRQKRRETTKKETPEQYWAVSDSEEMLQKILAPTTVGWTL